ncbi:MAG TPA: response regulator [Fimbriimonadaceae bacterium]|nr:response regulator [Fimbriimonadaceae bacterium]
MRKKDKTQKESLRRVLFVDDEEHLLESVERALRNRFEVHTALSGQKGLDTIRNSETFPVIVADLRMPHMGGIEFLERAIQISPKSVTIVLTGHADRANAVEAVEKGKVLHFLSKPCPMDALTKAVDAGVRLFDLEIEIEEIREFLRSVA